jgi:hypothetical protein
LSSRVQTNGCVLNWAAMPGRNYQLQSVDLLGDPWNMLAGVSNAPGLLQLQLNYTDGRAAISPQRFYRIKLLP